MGSWHGCWGAILRKDIDAKGAKAVSPRWVDTDKNDADRPNCRSRAKRSGRPNTFSPLPPQISFFSFRESSPGIVAAVQGHGTFKRALTGFFWIILCKRP